MGWASRRIFLGRIRKTGNDLLTKKKKKLNNENAFERLKEVDQIFISSIRKVQEKTTLVPFIGIQINRSLTEGYFLIKLLETVMNYQKSRLGKQDSRLRLSVLNLGSFKEVLNGTPEGPPKT